MFSRLKQSVYEPITRHLQEARISCLNMKNSAVKAHEMLPNTCHEDPISERKCSQWVHHFKNGVCNEGVQCSGARNKVFEDTLAEGKDWALSRE